MCALFSKLQPIMVAGIPKHFQTCKCFLPLRFCAGRHLTFIFFICARETTTKKLQGQFRGSLFPGEPRNAFFTHANTKPSSSAGPGASPRIGRAPLPRARRKEHPQPAASAGGRVGRELGLLLLLCLQRSCLRNLQQKSKTFCCRFLKLAVGFALLL